MLNFTKHDLIGNIDKTSFETQFLTPLKYDFSQNILIFTERKDDIRNIKAYLG